MNQRDSVPDDLKLWRSAVVPVDADLREACRPGTVRAIERAMSRSRRSRTHQRWLRGALVAAAVSAAGVGAVFTLSTHGPGEQAVAPASTPAVEVLAHAARGSVDVSRASQHHVLTGDHSMALSAGDVIRVATQSSLVVTLPHAGTSEWQGGSVLDVREVQEARQGFNLRHGHVAIKIPADAPPRHLVVTTPHADVVVVGTVFDVAVTGQGQQKVTDVSVQRGHVRIVRHGRTIANLTAGESWSSRTLGPLAAIQHESKPKAPAVPSSPRAATATEASTLKEQNRLYRAALDARNAGRDEEAVTLLSQLLVQYPESPLEQEAKVERLRALRRLGRNDEASQAARRYLAEHGDGFARDEAREAALPPPASSAEPDE